VKRILLSALFFAVSAFAATEFTAQVIGITDGDTLTVLRGDQQARIRLHGIDALEKVQQFGLEPWRASTPASSRSEGW
jgi:endonuclease YncB( thermonuclease family)